MTDLTPEERAQVRDEIKEAMLSAAQTCDAGNLPMGVKRMIQQLTEPKMNWRELLRMQLESTIKSDYTWLRSSRKGWHVDAVMPGMRTTSRSRTCDSNARAVAAKSGASQRSAASIRQ